MIYVDEIRRYGHRGEWCHMVTDGNVSELHAMAKKMGLKKSWFQDIIHHPHYDLRPSKRRLAVRFGAVECSSVEIVQKLRGVKYCDECGSEMIQEEYCPVCEG